MAKRQIDIKKRGKVQRKDKSVFLIITEGKNRTETLYLSHFQEQGKSYNIHFVKAGSNTDAESLYNTLLMKWNEKELSEEKGDKGFIVLDIDNDEHKAQMVQKLIQDKKPALEFIVSNPMFEVWFRMHFDYTTKYYSDGDAVIKDLRKYIVNYEKNVDCFESLRDLLDKARTNAARLEDHHSDKPWPSEECNPRTDMGKLMNYLVESKDGE